MNNPEACHTLLRMQPQTFKSLCKTLKEKYGLKSTRNMKVQESVAIFLYTCAHNEKRRVIAEIFGHSHETVTRKFHEVLSACEQLAGDFISERSHEELSVVPRGLREDDKYWPYFRDFIGAMDGTHVSVRVPRTEKLNFWCRHEYTSFNVFAFCDLDILFTYAYMGVPGSSHDANVLQLAMDNDPCFPTPPIGKYYLVDSGYANKSGFLAPFRGCVTRYHLREFQDGGLPQNDKEIFNRWHSSLRCVIERTFGVWKSKWRILTYHPRYDEAIQKIIVDAMMGLHNFILRSQIPDDDFERSDKFDISGHENTGRRDNIVQEENEDVRMQTVPREIATHLWLMRE